MTATTTQLSPKTLQQPEHHPRQPITMMRAFHQTKCLLRILPGATLASNQKKTQLKVRGDEKKKQKQQLIPQETDDDDEEQSFSMEPLSQDALEQGLFMAVDEGNLEKVQRYLDLGARVECYDSGGRTPLARASFGGHTELVVHLLKDRGAKVNGRSLNPCCQGDTPLIAAATPFGNSKILRLLLRHGADVTLCNHFGETALHRAASIASVWHSCGTVLLKHCQKHNHLQSLVHARDDMGHTALHKACAVGYEEAVAALIKEGGTDVRNNVSALHAACRGGHASIVKSLLTHSSSCNDNDEHKIDSDCGATLSANSIDPETQRLPLETALASEELYKAPRIHLLEDTVKGLIEHGARVDDKKALATASRHGVLASNVVFRLLVEGAAVSLKPTTTRRV